MDVVQPRPICATCQRAYSTCICQWVRPQSTAVEVIILQHPREVSEAKGTGRLLHLNLSGSVLIVCETLTDSARATITDPQRQSVLLYPLSCASTKDLGDQQGDHHNDLAANNVLNMCGTTLRLIVLDATWRKSRKMLHLNPLLQTLPRLSLQDPPPSRYAIRKAHQAHQLSTLEATCYALHQLGEQTDTINALLQAFDGFVAQQTSLQQTYQISRVSASDPPLR